MNMCERKAAGIAGNWAAVARWLLSSLERVHRQWLKSSQLHPLSGAFEELTQIRINNLIYKKM